MADTKQHQGSVKPQATTPDRHPGEYQKILNPDAMAGQNIGIHSAAPHKGQRTLRDVKALHARFNDWADDDLAQVPVLAEGTRLEQNASYIDLAAAHPMEFTATGDMQAGPENCYIPKREVPYELWNRLLGIDNVARTNVAGGT